MQHSRSVNTCNNDPSLVLETASGQMTLPFCAERWVEAYHSVSRRCASYRNIRGGFHSVTMRFPEILHEVCNVPGALESIAGHFDTLKTGRKAAHKFRLLGHPEFDRLVNDRKAPDSKWVTAVTDVVYQHSMASQWSRGNQNLHAGNQRMQKQAETAAKALEPTKERQLPYDTMKQSVFLNHARKVPSAETDNVCETRIRML